MIRSDIFYHFCKGPLITTSPPPQPTPNNPHFNSSEVVPNKSMVTGYWYATKYVLFRQSGKWPLCNSWCGETAKLARIYCTARKLAPFAAGSWLPKLFHFKTSILGKLSRATKLDELFPKQLSNPPPSHCFIKIAKFWQNIAVCNFLCIFMLFWFNCLFCAMHGI